MTIQLERSSRHDDMTTLINGRVPGYSLEAPFYTSQDVFDLDMAAIFDEALAVRGRRGGAARAR